MNDWEPISKIELLTEVSKGEGNMQPPILRYWMQIRIPPEKWREVEMGKEGSGFWVVGILGKQVVWYNDVEDGFNVSMYKTWGEIASYKCEQDNLDGTMYKLLRFLVD